MSGLVYLVDDDFDVREGLCVLLRTHGFTVRDFAGAVAFLDALSGLEPACLVIDLRMPLMNGHRLQEQLAAAGCDWPVIMITGHGDMEACRKAFRAGAVDFLTKPIEEMPLVAAINLAQTRLKRLISEAESLGQARRRLEKLTSREAQILGLVGEGLTTKEIARRLDVSPRTVETHRTHISEKLGTGSVAEMVRIHLAGGAAG